MFTYELTAACYRLLNDMFRLQPGETVAITLDSSSSQPVADAMAQAAVILEAKPLVIKNATPRGRSPGPAISTLSTARWCSTAL